VPLVIVTFQPVAALATEHPPVEVTVTGRFELAVGLTLKVEPYAAGLAGWGNVIVWFCVAGRAINLLPVLLEPDVLLSTTLNWSFETLVVVAPAVLVPITASEDV
jgi:hypothetical protein